MTVRPSRQWNQRRKPPREPDTYGPEGAAPEATGGEPEVAAPAGSGPLAASEASAASPVGSEPAAAASSDIRTTDGSPQEEPAPKPAAYEPAASERAVPTVSHTAPTAPAAQPAAPFVNPPRATLSLQEGPNWAELAVIFAASFAITAGIGWLALRFF